jgi:serine/threonine-protein kinase
MTPEQWTRVRDVLHQALDRPPDERAAWVEAACADEPTVRAEVTALLDAYEADDPLFEAPVAAADWAVDAGSASAGTSPSPEPGMRVGAYRLVEEIGVGGMGVVYRAERAVGDFEQTVAVKLLQRRLHAEEAEQRFRAERQVLASLDHPGIAQLLDGGVTEGGRPYLVMELVDGVPITDYADAHDLGLEARLDLLAQVFDAVQAAHGQLVVHRDLKPSNVLVTETERGPTVKLLDFGIAKLLGDALPVTRPQTRTGHHLMTPAYAAPEQVQGGEVATATDVYQLGVLAYELLAGTRPFDLSGKPLTEIQRIICEETPPYPSAQDGAPTRMLRGDLDTILRKALRKDPDRRYRSVEALATDLRRYRTGEPIEARPATLGYRARKFAERHRWGLGVGVLVAVLVAGFIGLLLQQQATIRQERDRARREAETARQVSDFLVDLFEASGPRRTQGDSTTAGALLRQGTRRADKLDDQPQVQARMFDVIGDVYQNRGQHDRADSVYRRALSTKRRAGLSRASIIESISDLGYEAWYLQHYERADSLLREAVRMDSTSRSLSRPERAELFRRHSHVLRSIGRSKRAEARARTALRLFQATHDGPHEKTAQALNALAMTLHAQDSLQQARRLYRETLAMQKKILDAPHPDLADTNNNLVYVLYAQNKYAAAEPRLRAVLRMDTALYSTSHPYVGLDYYNLAVSLRKQGKHEEAIPHYRRAITYRKKADTKRQSIVFAAYLELGESLTALGQYARAEEALRNAARIERRHRKSGTLGYSFRDHRSVLEAFVTLYEDWGKAERAKTYRQRLAQVERDTTDSNAQQAS